MKWPPAWLDPARRRDREADLERELRDHLRLEIEERSAAGASPREAHNAARRTMGNTALVMEDTRSTWRWAGLDRFAQDVRFAARSLRKSLSYTLLAAFILALGIGANTAIFTVVNAALLQPLPFEEPGRLTQLAQTAPRGIKSGGLFSVSVGNFVEWRAQQRVFEKIALYTAQGLNLTAATAPISCRPRR